MQNRSKEYREFPHIVWWRLPSLKVYLCIAISYALIFNQVVSPPERDSMIGATALVKGLIVVTRNESDFLPMGCQVLNPWKVE